MKVTAKFRVYSTSVHNFGNGYSNVEVNMNPDYGDGKNAEWAASTPTGSIKLTIDPTKTNAMELFQPNTPLTITFEESV